MQKGFTAPLIILGIVVLIAVAAGAFYFGRTIQKPISSPSPVVTSEIPKPTPIASPAPTGVDETANWKTYTNTKYGYSIKYPEAGKIEEYDEDQSPPDLLNVLSIDISSKDQTITEWVHVWSNQNVNVMDSLTRDKWCELLQPKLVGQLECQYNAKLPEVKINGLQAFKTTGGRDNSHYGSILYSTQRLYF